MITGSSLTRITFLDSSRMSLLALKTNSHQLWLASSILQGGGEAWLSDHKIFKIFISLPLTPYLPLKCCARGQARYLHNIPYNLQAHHKTYKHMSH